MLRHRRQQYITARHVDVHDPLNEDLTMSTSTIAAPIATAPRAGTRSSALADRLIQGARALANFASTLSDSDWQTRVPQDGRKVGVMVHHVASMYPIEIQLAQLLASGKAVTDVTWDVVAGINAMHAQEFDGVTKEAALALLKQNSVAAEAAVRALSDEELDRAAPVSLNADAPLTCQFFIEDHALRHSYHHFARIRAALKAAAA